MASIYTKIKKDGYPGEITEQNRAMADRGPGASDFYADEKVALGINTDNRDHLFRTSNALKERGLYVAVDGDVYNKEELKKEENLRGETTPEILAELYERYFTDFLTKLNGEFAFLIYDKNRGVVFVARDRFGVKPLYYTNHTKSGRLLLSSEIKGFLPDEDFVKEFNEKKLRSFLSFQYSPGVDTFFKGVYTIAPASYLLIDLNHDDYSLSSYEEYKIRPVKGDEKELEEELISLLKQAVERRRGDNIGSFLSGGLDSSLITALLMPEKSFSIGFDEETGIFDESIHAKELSDLLGIENIKYRLTGEEAFDHLGEIQYLSDEPHGNLSTIPLYFLARNAKKHVDVVQSGEGADEFFGGYASFIDGPQMSRYKKLPNFLRRGVRGIAKHGKDSFSKKLTEAGSRPEEYFIGEAKIFSNDDAAALLKPPYNEGYDTDYYTEPMYKAYRGLDDLEKKQMIDIELFMPGDILVKADRMVASCGLDVRAPFMDRDVIDFSAGLEDDLKAKGGKSKILLRRAAEDILPDEWVKRRKLGFPVPMKYWLLREGIYHRVRDVFSSETAEQFFDTVAITKLLDDHYRQKAANQRYIYVIYAFLIWYDEYFIKR